MQRFGLSRICRNVRSIAKLGLRTAAMALALACLVPPTHAQDQTPQDREVRDIRSLNYTEKQALLKLIREELRDVLNQTEPFPGQAAYTPLKVKFRTEARNEVLVIDIGAANGPFSGSADMSELGSALENPVIDILNELDISHPDFDYEFGGRDWYYYNPEDRQNQREYELRMQRKGAETTIPPQDAKVVVSAMHGYYRRVLMTDNAWALQRPTQSNGIYEDLITPEFVAPLINHLIARSSVTSVDLPRSQSEETHPESDYPWWQVAGRYYLEVLYPDNPEIWHSLERPLPHRNNLWHYDEDIRSRPLFANHIGADAILNLHTNAANPSATGTRAYVAPDRPYDLELANNILCGMKELIHAQEAYRDFNVANQAEASPKYGENNKASMPAVVLEVGFHTNAGDAAALQDPVFRDAAMKGVEKGFRLQTEGKICEPFEIASIPDVTIPRQSTTDVPVNFKGFPFFPVTLTVDSVACPAGHICTGGTVTYVEQQDSPFYFQFSCPGSSNSTTTYHWRSYLTDADGVMTNAVEHDLTCTPTSGTVPAGKPSAGVGPAN